MEAKRPFCDGYQRKRIYQEGWCSTCKELKCNTEACQNLWDTFTVFAHEVEHEIIKFSGRDIDNRDRGRTIWGFTGYQSREPSGYLRVEDLRDLIRWLEYAIRRRECDYMYFRETGRGLDRGHWGHIVMLRDSLNDIFKELYEPSPPSFTLSSH